MGKKGLLSVPAMPSASEEKPDTKPTKSFHRDNFLVTTTSKSWLILIRNTDGASRTSHPI